MATKKPKTKRMALGGMAAGVVSNVLKPSAPKPQSRFAQAAAKAPSRGALGGNRPPAGANLMQAYKAYSAQKPAMKKGGTVKKKAVKK